VDLKEGQEHDDNMKQEEEQDDDEKIRCSIQKIRESAKNLADPRSSANLGSLKSNLTLEDFDTPPESPGVEAELLSDSESLNSTLSLSETITEIASISQSNTCKDVEINKEINKEQTGDTENKLNGHLDHQISDISETFEEITMEDIREDSDTMQETETTGEKSKNPGENLNPFEAEELPPKPPPRHKKRDRVKNLNFGGSVDRCLDLSECHQNDILFRTGSCLQLRKTENNYLKGNMSILIVSAGGLRHQWKQRWVVYDKKQCKLRFFKSDKEEEIINEVDVLSATFVFDVENDQNGQFKMCTKDGEHTLEVGTSENRLYWLQQLQRARREFTQNITAHYREKSRSSVGLLKENTPDGEVKESSPFKDILATMERPPEAPKSADYVVKKSFFQNFARKPSFKLVRSSSDRTPSPTRLDPTSPTSSKTTSPTHGASGFQALSKIRRSMREKRPPTGAMTPKSVEDMSKELIGVKDDLQASQDEAWSSKEVILVLRKQIESLQKEKETLSAMQPQLAEGQLLEILREKDRSIVELETSAKHRQMEYDQLADKLYKTQQESGTQLQIIEVKDESIVKLSNQLHELELKEKMGVQISPPLLCNGDTSNIFFCEKVCVGTQSDLDKQKESLQDTVTAYEMQNKFLNKEVLELNQLRQQANDREQKLFIEASDWEAKFYQIQSKYLLLLNELHNPQVMVSASRQEMVGHLLKDIVESSEKPNLTTQSSNYDRFGFRFDEDGNEASLEEKAERLRKVAQENLEESQLSAEEVESRWDGVVTNLGKTVHFIVSSDVKNLIRRGIPINQRGIVWKAIVDHRIRSHHDRSQADYYKALLSNYNPGLQLSPAAKQIELDLLRTLPSNKHYDGPHAPGIAKLRRVLLAYSLHNPEIEYCQGFNRIAAIALLFMNEEDAFWCFVYIVEELLPEEYYSKQLIGVQVDQEVFKELICEKLPNLAIHLESHRVDPTLFSLNWFLCLFVDSLPVNTYLHIWDAFLFEGCKVLFRYAVAILKLIEDKLLAANDYMSIFNTFRTEIDTLSDVKTLTHTAFHELNPFPMRSITHKREHHHKILKAQMESLEVIRRDYRKNSVALNPPSKAKHVHSDEEET